MHLRHYQEEVRDLKSEVESLKIQLKWSEDRTTNELLRHLLADYRDARERQAQILAAGDRIIDPVTVCDSFADAVSNPHYDGPNKKYLSDDGLWAIACGRDAVAGAKTDVRVTVWDGDVPTTDTVVHRGVWLSSAGRGELAKVQIISAKERHNEP